MKTKQAPPEEAELHVENIGGISETAVEVEPGINVLSGRNATNRTSLLQALMAALGSENISLKGDADAGRVDFTIGSDQYTREVTRQNGGLSFAGDPYLDDPVGADLFAFLLESNESRQAVARGDNLREIIMQPVDTAKIQAEIESLVDEKDEIDEQLAELDSLSEGLPALEQKRTSLEEEIEDKRAEIEDVRTEIENTDADVEQTRDEKSKLEEKLAELQDKRSELQEIRSHLDTERDSLDALEDDKTEIENALADTSETSPERIEEIENQISRLRDQQNRLVTNINSLQSVIQFNEDMLEGEKTGFLSELTDEDEGDITEELLPDSSNLTCWTCGSEVEEDQIQGNVERLRSLHQDMLKQRNGISSDIDELEDKRRELESQQQRYENLERNLERTESEIENRQDEVEALEERHEEALAEIETLEAEVEEFRDQDYSTILDLHTEANELEFELDQLTDDLEAVTDEIETIEERLSNREDLEARRESVQQELTEARNRIERIETEAIEEFNTRMDELLAVLQYENIERIWLERREREVREGRRKVSRSAFDLHVIRSTAEGTTYEDTVDHLSESEREMTGLVFALAGYLTHDLYETIPIMVLDSLEAFDSERIADLVDYLGEYTEYLFVALLPEDASAIDDEHHYVTEI